ncbi:MAG: hypothetical protein ACXWVD_04730 [Telluria sp.]
MTAVAAHGSRLERSILISSFLLLFPGFFFYNFLLGTGKIRAILGGYFAAVSLLAVLPLVLLYIRQIRRDPHRLVRSELAFLIFLAYFAIVVAVHGANGANPAIVTAHILGIMYLANTLIMAKMIDFGTTEFRIPAIMCLLGMSAIVMANSVEGTFRMDELGAAKDPASLATYQGFARSYLVTFLPVIAFTRSLPLRALLYASGGVTLFLNTARTEFVALLFAIPIIEFYFSRHKFMFVLVLASLAALISMNFHLILDQLPPNRILELADLAHSSSALARQRLTEQAIKTISNYPIFGDYASYAPGYYAHNILSAWVDLGIFGFVFLLAILIVPATSMMFNGLLPRRVNGAFLLAFTFACVAILLVVKSHYFMDMLIGATVGAYSAYQYGRRPAAHRAPIPAPAPIEPRSAPP